MKENIKLITHDRVVHADDALAAAMLRMVYGQVEILRTRDPVVLKAEAGKPGVFFLDVGGRYEPQLRLFDHHQPSGAGFRNAQASEWPFATAGLVWAHYGEDAVKALIPQLSDDGVREVVSHIDESLIKYIDAVDCGVRLKTAGPSLSAVIGSFNTAWFEPEQEVFPLVLDLSQAILSNFIKRYAGKVLAREKVRQAERTMDGKVLVLEGCHPWVTVVSEEMPEVLMVVYPVEAGNGQSQWQIRCATNEDFSSRIKLPASWGGLEREELAAVSGEPEAVFCHRSLHLAGALCRSAAMSMAQRAITQHQLVSEVKAA